MGRKIVAKTGEYTNSNGETKSRWTSIGVIMSNNDGDYVLLDPTVSLAGVQSAQNALAVSQGKTVRDRIMCSVFDDDNNQQQQPQQRQQPAPQQQRQAPQQQAQQAPSVDDFDDDIPFN